MTRAPAADVVLTGARLFTGTGDEVILDGAVWISGRHVRRVGSADVMRDVPVDVARIDVHGRFVMPGMTESHAHLSYADDGPTELDRTPVEQAMLTSVANARLMLGSGFTSAISFGSVHTSTSSCATRSRAVQHLGLAWLRRVVTWAAPRATPICTKSGPSRMSKAWA